MSRPICVICQVEMKVEKNDVAVEYCTANSDLAKTGNSLEIRLGDLWKCTECDCRVVMGLASKALSESWLPDYPAVLARYSKRIKVFV